MNDKLKIAYIAAGAGGMYCGSCIRDNSLARAVREMGHDIALIPTYTPMRTDEPTESIDRLFFNGVNVYLEQKFPWARNKHPWLDRLLNRPGIVNYLAKVNASTSARDLGELTISMLRGEAGYQHKELQNLVDWLAQDYRPQIVQITNTLLAGLAKGIRSALNVPVLCAMQGEDIFIDDLVEPYKSEVLSLLREKARDVDGFIATSDYYRTYMSGYLDVPINKIHTVPLGINTSGHGQNPSPPQHPFVIGYLARICPEKGLHILVDAVAALASRVGVENIRLKAAGYLGKRDQDYFRMVQQRAERLGIGEIFEYHGEISREEKINYLNTLHVFSVPTAYREPKGLYVLEALANGVPVVQPDHGSFPEIVSATNGGILVTPDAPDALADAIHKLMEKPDLREQLGRQGKAVVHRKFTEQNMAKATLGIYRQYLGEAVTRANVPETGGV